MSMRYAIPALVMVGLLALLGVGLTLNPREVPSPLIGQPAPDFRLTTLDGRPFSVQDLRGKPALVNFWASWCAGCQVEHPLLLRLAREDGVAIFGMDYKDEPDAARQWLARHGNPYTEIVADPAGTAGLDWGVYGVPETFVLDAQGVIRYKHIGPVTEEAWRDQIRPLLAERAP
ncbi:MAG: DsbE family thiol:disulfide interchange protein [Gammaproteobacteria bacterium]|nr:DsbE family thiol:disulfide interchange protein [Gammaproteobacteria bacterium]